jgi:hypothetical protein
MKSESIAKVCRSGIDGPLMTDKAAGEAYRAARKYKLDGPTVWRRKKPNVKKG